MSVLKELIERFQDLPGIGPKSAERLAYFLVRRPKEEAIALARAITQALDTLRPCSVCGHIAEEDPCSICADGTRDRECICVVESSRELEALEAVGEFHGVYHVLGGRVSPSEGVALNDLNLAPLLETIASKDVREVVLAMNPTFEGEATATMLARELASAPVKVTRIARGIPSGAEIVHMNAAVLGDALRGRSASDA
ncbi:MAG: recombination mediator RecR [Planctomycetota bacterium]